MRLELPFKTVKGVTVDEVAQRLVPCGFCRDPTKVSSIVQYGQHLLLDNITRYVAERPHDDFYRPLLGLHGW